MTQSSSALINDINQVSNYRHFYVNTMYLLGDILLSNGQFYTNLTLELGLIILVGKLMNASYSCVIISFILAKSAFEGLK